MTNQAASPAKPTLQIFKAKLAWRKDLNTNFAEFKFELLEPNRISFEAGQYLLLEVPETGHQRSYSIASPPSLDHAIHLLVDFTPQGPGSKYLQSLKPGEEVKMIAPLGRFVISDQDSQIGQTEKKIVLLATGSGIAPYRSMIEDRLITKKDYRPLTLIWGLRYESDQFWYDDFSLLALQHPNFSFQPVLSRPNEGWQFHKGYVTDVLSIQDDFSETGYFLCGNGSMVKDAREMLTQKGVAPEKIHFETFF